MPHLLNESSIDWLLLFKWKKYSGAKRAAPEEIYTFSQDGMYYGDQPPLVLEKYKVKFKNVYKGLHLRDPLDKMETH